MLKMRARRQPPLILRWQPPEDPLPTRVIRATRAPRSRAWFERDSRAIVRNGDRPFDFCARIQQLVMDIAVRTPDFRHVQSPRILVSVSQARGSSLGGLQARVTPLRFPGGALTRQRSGVPFQIQRYFNGDHEYLYLLTFSLPRFLDQEFDQKLITIFHELYHLSPAFDGDLRRHTGRYALHTHSQKEYDQHMVGYARTYLATKPEPALYGFLRMTFAQLEEQFGAVTGIVVPRPKMIPLVPPYVPQAAMGQQVEVKNPHPPG
jgi:hypothetical protein